MAPMFVMGLFGFIGKAVKGVGKAIGGAVKLGVGVAKFGLQSGLLPIPGGGLVGKVAGTLLASKRPMSNPKMTAAPQLLNVPTLLRAKPGPTLMKATSILARTVSTPRMQQMSPVLPGGAIATKNGPVAMNGGSPPLNFSGSASPSRKRKKRSTSRKRSSAKRRGRKRKLKFGSPAWRKKYLGHGRRKKRKRAA